MAPELGAQDVAAVTARDLDDPCTTPLGLPLTGSFWTGSDGRRLSTHIASFNEVWETAVVVSLRESALRASYGSISLVRELRGFLWSSRGADTDSDFDEALETAGAVSVINSEGGFSWRSVLRAFDSSLSFRELRAFLWSSRGTERHSGFDEEWETVVAVSLRESTSRALNSSSSLVRELQGFLWSSRGGDTESGFDGLGRAWERVI